MATTKTAAKISATKTATKNAKQTITIGLQLETVHYLKVLGHSEALDGRGSVEDVLVHLAASAAAGVQRAGSWERGWVHHAFGTAWEAHLAPDPTTPWGVLPKAAPKGPKASPKRAPKGGV